MTPIAISLRELRRTRGLSLRELAASAAISHRELIHIEQGTVDPRLSTVERLVEALGVSVQRLLDQGKAPKRRRARRTRR